MSALHNFTMFIAQAPTPGGLVPKGGAAQGAPPGTPKGGGAVGGPQGQGGGGAMMAVGPRCDDTRFIGVEVVKSFSDVEEEFDAVIVTDVNRAKLSFDAAVEACGVTRVLAPRLLGLRLPAKATEGAV